MTSSRDVKLEADGGVLYFKYLDWDSAFFGIDSYIVEENRSVLEPSAELASMVEGRLTNSFVTAKVDAAIPSAALDFLQRTGFRYIETELTLKFKPEPVRPPATGPPIEIFRPQNGKGLPFEELGSVFSLTRFHSDPNIAPEQADRIWVEYIRNFQPSAVNHMFVANISGETAGVILVNQRPEENESFLFFVAVLREFRNLRVGSRLIGHVVEQFKETDILTGSQAKNLPALNFYIRNGFSLIERSKVVLHRWST